MHHSLFGLRLLLQVAVDVQHHQTMASLQQKVNAREQIVGWFSTGTLDMSSGIDALIHSFYTNECPNPVHLVVDTTLQNDRLAVKAFVSRSLVLRGQELAREFQEIECEIRTIDAERAGGELLVEESVDSIPTEMKGLASSMTKLKQCLKVAEDYVTDVLEGRQKGSVSIGRYLAETVATIPHFSTEELTKLLQDSQHDLLLTSYLAGLIRAHISLADKLGTMQLPLL